MGSVLNAPELIDHCSEAFLRAGVADGPARQVARGLVLADARGLSSHGVSRMDIYVRRLLSGKINPAPHVEVVRESAATLLLDGDNGLGAAVAMEAMDRVIGKARETGIAFATIRNSNHFGIAGLIAERATDAGFIGYAASNGPARMPAYGSSRPVFGTSPFAYTFPTGSGMPIVVDMATCVVARGKIMMAARAGETIPEGWALDVEGQPTTDPHRALTGSVLPFAGPKGSAIATSIEILTGILGGNAWGRGVGDMYQEGTGPTGTSHCLIALDPNALIGRDAYEANLADLIAQIKSDPGAGATGVYLPGEREQIAQRHAMEQGLSLPPNVVVELNELFAKLNLQPIAPKIHEGAHL